MLETDVPEDRTLEIDSPFEVRADMTADSEIVYQTNRRQTPNGWNTAFIGTNRYTIKPGERRAPMPKVLQNLSVRRKLALLAIVVLTILRFRKARVHL